SQAKFRNAKSALSQQSVAHDALPLRELLFHRPAVAIPPSSARICGGSVNRPAARFSRRWATDDVPGINRMLGERCSSHASATCLGVDPSRAATSDRVGDWGGGNPPSGKYGT